MVSSLAGDRPRWRRDERALYFIRQEAKSSDIWSVSVDTSSLRKMTNLDDRRGSLGPRALATDERYLYFTWEEPNQDLWLMDVEPPDSN